MKVVILNDGNLRSMLFSNLIACYFSLVTSLTTSQTCSSTIKTVYVTVFFFSHGFCQVHTNTVNRLYDRLIRVLSF